MILNNIMLYSLDHGLSMTFSEQLHSAAYDTAMCLLNALLQRPGHYVEEEAEMPEKV